jgi:hypothetical protein
LPFARPSTLSTTSGIFERALSMDTTPDDVFAFLDNPPERLIRPAEGGTPGIDFAAPDPDRQEWRIWDGYLQSSWLLFREMLGRTSSAQTLIFPAMFNLRHGLEVGLKWHIRYADGSVPRRTGHDLGALIDIFRATAVGLDDDATYICDYHLGLIADLARIDPRSLAFRYSTGLDGAPISIPGSPWDLRNLSFAVEHLQLWFDHLAGYIDMSSEDFQAMLRESRAT